MKYSEDELLQFGKLLNIYSSIEIQAHDFGKIEHLLDQEFTVQLPPRKVEFPGDKTTELIIMKFPGHPVHIPVKEILKKAALPAAKAFVKFSPVDVGFSVLETLQSLVERATWLTKAQLAICRAVLLKMQEKHYKVLSEKGANIKEIQEAMRAQLEDPPADLEGQIKLLTEKGVLMTEQSGLETFYLVVP